MPTARVAAAPATTGASTRNRSSRAAGRVVAQLPRAINHPAKLNKASVIAAPEGLRRVTRNGTCRMLVDGALKRFKEKFGATGGFIVIGRRGHYSGAVTRQTAKSPGRTPMSAQMVLLPVFVLVGLTFVVFFWTGSGRRGPLAGRAAHTSGARDAMGDQPPLAI